MNKGTWPWLKSGVLSSMSDAQLLYRYAQLGEGTAFQLLMKRHGPLVWGVCRRLLHCDHDADDAFQATFLVLSKKASSLRNPQALTSWLYGVAHRISRKVLSRKRFHAPLEAAPEPSAIPADALLLREQSLLMDEAVLALPGELRNVFLLCEVEELTAQAAAHRLNIPEGTVNSRLHRARQRLQGLLSQRGITSAVSASTLLAAGAIPEALAAHTARSILTSTTIASIQALAYGVLSTMFWMKCSAVVLVTVSLGIVGAGAATGLTQGSGDRKTAPGVTTKVQLLDDKDRRIQELEAKLKQMERIAQDMRDQVAQMRIEQDKVQQFLQKELISQVENKKLQQQKQDEVKLLQAKALEAEKLAFEKATRAEQVRARHYEEQMQHLLNAQRQLNTHVKELSQQMAEIETQILRASEQERAMQRNRQKLEKCEDDLAAFKDVSPKDNPKLKLLMEIREKLTSEIQKQQAHVADKQIHTGSFARLSAQLKLREKLLQEVDERLLRHQLRLDGK